MKRIAILGSTGSIGANALDVVSRSPKSQFKVQALSADSNIGKLASQARIFKPEFICVRDHALASEIRESLPSQTKILCGVEGLKEIVSRGDIDIILFAISGSVCSIPLIEAIKHKKHIALANKESLVSAGEIIMKLAHKHNVKIVPIDSEHSAIFQCIEGRRDYLHKIFLTGSGGPLLNIPKSKFGKLSRKFILDHPRWKMGEKISVDSATMMNKGLEIIEARWLFDVDEEMIEVLIHPEAIIHSMVELIDGAIFAQMSLPDMRLPIQYAITYPYRAMSLVPRAGLLNVGKLSLKAPDLEKFPCLGFARSAIRSGGTLPAVLNASNEESVKEYLSGGINFTMIPDIIEKVMSRHKNLKGRDLTIENIIDAEIWAKEEVKILCR